MFRDTNGAHRALEVYLFVLVPTNIAVQLSGRADILVVIVRRAIILTGKYGAYAGLAKWMVWGILLRNAPARDAVPHDATARTWRLRVVNPIEHG